MPTTARELEAQFFRSLNAVVEPWVRAGLGSPGLIPAGLVVLETTGRRSGTPRRTPLVGGLLEGRLIVSTVRGTRSQWVRNALTTPAVRYWLLGAEHQGVATILAADVGNASPDAFPPLISHLVAGPFAAAIALGWAFAVITPAIAAE
ncbi:MAG: nitroreductase/quinone reductase family protein [Anaerolineaceae bacterium]